jgi:hypothetical protein
MFHFFFFLSPYVRFWTVSFMAFRATERREKGLKDINKKFLENRISFLVLLAGWGRVQWPGVGRMFERKAQKKMNARCSTKTINLKKSRTRINPKSSWKDLIDLLLHCKYRWSTLQRSPCNYAMEKKLHLGRRKEMNEHKTTINGNKASSKVHNMHIWSSLIYVTFTFHFARDQRKAAADFSSS